MKYNLDYIAHNNKLRVVNPKLKILYTFLTLIISLFSKNIFVPLIAFLVSSYLIIFRARVPVKIYLYLLLPTIAFALFNLIFMSFWYGKIVIFKIFFITFKLEGLKQGILIFFRILGGVSTMLFLALTTPIIELFYVLRRYLPKEFIDIALMMYKFIFDLLDTFLTMKNAQETRLGYKDVKTSYKSLGMLMSNLFIRTYEKSEKIYISMASRGYDGDIRILTELPNLKLKNLFIVLLFEFLLALLALTLPPLL
ncbi:cobalt ECF transporter T component CbiQ [Methanocaldococcus infernus]